MRAEGGGRRTDDGNQKSESGLQRTDPVQATFLSPDLTSNLRLSKKQVELFNQRNSWYVAKNKGTT